MIERSCSYTTQVGRLSLKRGGRSPSSRPQRAETTIAEGGRVSLGVEERVAKGVPVMARRATEKIVLRLGI